MVVRRVVVGNPRTTSTRLRTTILQLLHERAATVTELAAALERPSSQDIYPADHPAPPAPQ